jgi:ribosomal protein S18 acetylase RimI-like enzyme
MNKPNKKLSIRPLTPADLEKVLDIDEQLVGRRRPGFYNKRLAAALSEPDIYIYIGCEVDGVLQGYLIPRIINEEYGETEPIAVMDVIGVMPNQQNHGIANAMLETLYEILRHKNISILTTQADWHNTSMLRFLAAKEFEIGPIHVLERDVANIDTHLRSDPIKTSYMTEGGETDYSDSNGDDAGTLARDVITCRSLEEKDLPDLIRIDSKVTGVQRTSYYQRKLREVMDESGIRVSLVAELDEQPCGFIMTRVDYGEFDRLDPTAVLDTIAVDPRLGHHLIGTALLSQLLTNLNVLHIETIRTVVHSDQFDIMHFLMRNGFKNSQRMSFSCRVE